MSKLIFFINPYGEGMRLMLELKKGGYRVTTNLSLLPNADLFIAYVPQKGWMKDKISTTMMDTAVEEGVTTMCLFPGQTLSNYEEVLKCLLDEGTNEQFSKFIGDIYYSEGVSNE